MKEGIFVIVFAPIALKKNYKILIPQQVMK